MVDGHFVTTAHYRCEDCKDCPRRSACCQAKDPEQPKEVTLKKTFWDKRAQSQANITTERGIYLRMCRSIQAEGAFALLKTDFGFRRFLTRGKQNVRTELFFLAVAFNLKKLWMKRENGRLKTHLSEIRVAWSNANRIYFREVLLSEQSLVCYALNLKKQKVFHTLDAYTLSLRTKKLPQNFYILRQLLFYRDSNPERVSAVKKTVQWTIFRREVRSGCAARTDDANEVPRHHPTHCAINPLETLLRCLLSAGSNDQSRLRA